MRLKETSDALKRHRRTFHLARHNPERWEQERNITLSENLCDVRETTSKLEGEAEANKKLLECRQQQIDCLTEELAASQTAQENLRQINVMTSNELKSKDESLEKKSNDLLNLQNQNSKLRDRDLKLQGRNSKLSKEIRRLQMKALRAPGQRSHAVEVAIAKTADELRARSNIWRIKRPDGRIENWVRDLTCRLITHRRVPTTQIPGTISDILRAIKSNAESHNQTDDIEVDARTDLSDVETFSDRSARRFPLEGHVMGKLQVAREFKAAPAWTASGDGSTYKGVISVAHFATFPPVPSTNEANGEVNCVPRRRFLGATREVNHKTSTQLENWIGLHVDIASVNNESPGGSKDPIKATEIGRKATGYSADHAADQLKLSRELCAHKLSCDHQLRGEEAIKLKSEGEIKEVVDQKFCDILAEISDWKGWETHSREDQEKLFERLINEVHIHFGKLALAELPERLQRIAGLWRWSGCCMHKDLNTFKGGAVRLSAFWKKARLKGPVKLLSREKEEREELGIGTTDHEPNKSSGGAAKLADLVGALIRNRDETKGCPDKFRTYSWDHLGYEISFPDTSNTRYQCYGEAATELIQRLDFYTDFLIQHGKSKRRAAGLNHMEMNILKGLMDPMTHTELAVFALYSEAISRPYAATVRGSFNEHKNALDLGPIHLQIITHIDILIGNPDLLIGDHTSYETGALYRTRWEDAVINHIHSIRDRLPHLRQALVAFLRGARVKWVDFTKEFSDGSAIANSTAEERLLSHRSPTNDHSEGAVASNNGWSRHAPSMKTHQKNARLFIQLNGPDIETFFHELPEPDRAFARKKAREMDAAKLPAKEREAQARANREAVEEEQREAARLKEHRETKEAEECRMIDGFQPILDLEAFLLLPDDKPSNDFLKRQLVWHRRVGRDKTLPSGTFSRMSKGPMKKLVVEALTRWTQGETGDVTIVDLGSENTEDSCAKTTTAEEDDYDHDFPQGTLATRSQSPTSKISHCDPLAIPGGRSLLPANFGCEWDPVNYSCLYDCLFTTFTWIYLHAPRTWQEKWTQESAIASFLSDHFEKVSSALSGSTPDHTVPALFTEGRDAWRDKISQRYPVEFPRRGPEYASIIQMLGVLADDRNPTHYATIILSCGTPGCPVRMKNLRPRPYMLLPSDWNTATGRTSPPHHESLETWIKAHYSSPHLSKTADRCTQCQQCFSRELVFREPTWIWFEIFPQFRHVILPAFKISLGSATLRLAAAMYYDGNHYRARLCDPSEAWWFYDGQWYGGRPTPIPKITDERDLFQCGSDFNITALVYCLADW